MVVVIGGRTRSGSGASSAAVAVVVAGRRIDRSDADVVGTLVDHATYVGDKIMDARARSVACSEEEHVQEQDGVVVE